MVYLLPVKLSEVQSKPYAVSSSGELKTLSGGSFHI
jgi:hypothetical protein